MARAFHRTFISALAGLTLLAGCEEGALPFLNSNPDAPDAMEEGGPAAATVVEKDVEAPDVFAASEPGLWDGRPSFGGVWLAHPDVADPERIMIRNEANGQSVVGVLYPRDPNFPGPRFQVSSDAAEALNMLAGQPTVLDVVALRREEVEIPAAVPAEETVDLDEATGADIEASSLDDPIAAAEAAIVAAESEATEEAAAETEEVAVIQPAPEPEPEPEPTPAPAETALEKPFIQIGIFSVEQNAEDTAESLRRIGVIPSVRAQESSGKAFWRVLVGPATNARDQRDVLAKVRELGFEDAYYVTN